VDFLQVVLEERAERVEADRDLWHVHPEKRQEVVRLRTRAQQDQR
jgi:hypothetical protein